MYDEKFMRRAIDISAQAIDKPGTRPYGAVVVKDGKVVGEGLNHAPAKFDPTSHGETEAIRNACQKSQDARSVGLRHVRVIRALLTLRLGHDAVRHWAPLLRRLGRAGIALRTAPCAHSACPDSLRAQVGLPPEKREMPVEQKLDGEALAVIETFIEKHGK